MTRWECLRCGQQYCTTQPVWPSLLCGCGALGTEMVRFGSHQTTIGCTDCGDFKLRIVLDLGEEDS